MTKSLSSRSGFSDRYQKKLRAYLKKGTAAKPAAAAKLGKDAADSGVQILDLAIIHERAVLAEAESLSSNAARDRMLRRAGKFFAATVLPMEETHRAAREANASLIKLNHSLARQNRDISVSSRKLKTEIVKRKELEKALRKSKNRSSQLLEQSQDLQDELRQLSRQILSTQEDERKRISRELHDIIAQTLTGINMHLATLQIEAARNKKGLTKNIARTQKLVEEAVERVHQFARELRPAVLDDLGLNPALRSLIKGYTKETGIKVSLKTFTGQAGLSNEERTVLYRVAQEALNNTARHTHASRVAINIKELSDSITMQIRNNGQSFNVDRALRSKKNVRMGLLGMRERVEMVGGKFTITSKPGKGTTILVELPSGRGAKRSAQK